MKNFKKIVKFLCNNEMTISCMESCTGGGVANAITSVEGSSDVIKYSAVTYSNEYKIKMGVSKEVIDKYSVYSKETAREMAYNIAKFANSTIGVGVTGKLNRIDKNNLYSNDNEVYVCIYENGNYHDYLFEVPNKTRMQSKNYIIQRIIDILEDLLF